jgi:hypothetical protein
VRVGVGADVRRGRDAEGGFAAVDALVALMILATTITLCLRAVETARLAAVSGMEMRQSTQLLRGLLDSPVGQPGVITGKTPAFRWRVATDRTASGEDVAAALLCERTAQAVAIRSGRSYSLSTADVCPRDISR